MAGTSPAMTNERLPSGVARHGRQAHARNAASGLGQFRAGAFPRPIQPTGQSMANVVAICGSLRKGSFNRQLMNASIGLAPEGMTIKEAPSFAKIPIYNFDDQQSTGFPQGLRCAERGDPRRRRRADRVAGIQLVDPGGPEERHRLAVALQGSVVQGQAGGDPVGAPGGLLGGSRMQYHLRMASARDRRAGVRQARGDRQHGGAEIRRRQADRSGRDRPDQAAACRVRQVHRPGQGLPIQQEEQGATPCMQS